MAFFTFTHFLLVFWYIGVSLCASQPEISFITPDQTKDIGSSVVFECTTNNTQDYTVIWLKKNQANDPTYLSHGREMTSKKDKRIQLMIDPKNETYSLNITDLRAEDYGTYECQIVLSISEKLTKHVQLYINIPPRILQMSHIEPLGPIEMGKPAKIICKAEGYPKPTITWTRENNAILPGGGLSLVTDIFHIESTMKQDRGIYYCLASNGIGKDKKSFDLDVIFAPTISTPRPKVAQSINYNAELICIIEAYPSPEISWHRNGRRMTNLDIHSYNIRTSSDEITTSKLKIRRLTVEDYGDYYCRAVNGVGISEARINLFESSIPVLQDSQDWD